MNLSHSISSVLSRPRVSNADRRSAGPAHSRGTFLPTQVALLVGLGVLAVMAAVGGSAGAKGGPKHKHEVWQGDPEAVGPEDSDPYPARLIYAGDDPQAAEKAVADDRKKRS